MKKNLFLISVVALALGACSNDSTIEQNTATELQPAEIAFSPLTQPSTRTDCYNAVPSTSFPGNYTMDVSANVNAGLTYFSGINFAQDGTYWEGAAPQYWPLSPATLNFLAVTNWTTTPASVVSTAFTNCAQSAVVTLGNNAPTDLTSPSVSNAQHDLMYAVGRGVVTQSGNNLTYAGNSAGNATPVDMVFKHALAWVNFTVQTAADYGTGFKLNSITLHNAYYGGTYTLNNATNYNYVYDGNTYDSRTATPITGTWGNTPTNQGANVVVPGWTSGTSLSTTPATVGNGLIIVPTYGLTPAANSFTGFTIEYQFNGQTFSYTHNENVTVEQAKKYTYAITFTLTEIQINPSVTGWDAVSSTPVPVPGS